MNQSDIEILRDLAKQYMEICQDPLQEQKRDLWRKHNSFKNMPTPIYIRSFAWREMPEAKLLCQNDFFRNYEDFFRQAIFRSTFGDDFIFEPWITVNAVYKCNGWGLESKKKYVDNNDETLTAYKLEYALKEETDFAQMLAPGTKLMKLKLLKKQKL